MADKKPAKKDTKDPKKLNKQCLWLRRVPTSVGLLIFFAALAIAVGIGLIVCI